MVQQIIAVLFVVFAVLTLLTIRVVTKKDYQAPHGGGVVLAGIWSCTLYLAIANLCYLL